MISLPEHIRLEMDIDTLSSRKPGCDEIDAITFHKREHARDTRGRLRFQDLHEELILDQLSLDSTEED